MARQESVMKLGYFPTPPCVSDSIAKMLDLPSDLTALDPCCGCGQAMETVAPVATRYGVELAVNRAEESRDRFYRVMNCDFKSARISHNAFGLVFCNPPYASTTDGRLEPMFLTRSLNYLRPGGLLVLIIPIGQYTSRITDQLYRNCEDFRHYRFPESEYEAFKQTVMVCRKRAVPLDTKCIDFAAREKYEGDRKQFADSFCHELPYLPETHEDRMKCAVGVMPATWYPFELPTDVYVHLLAESDVPRSQPNLDLLGCGSPALPLKKGHLALVLASGLINGVYEYDGEAHVAKGTIVRQEHKSVEKTKSPDGTPIRIETKIDTFSIVIRVMLANGEIKDLAGAKAHTDEEEEGKDVAA